MPHGSNPWRPKGSKESEATKATVEEHALPWGAFPSTRATRWSNCYGKDLANINVSHSFIAWQKEDICLKEYP